MKPLKVVHLTSGHTAFDVRIFHKECRTLARAGLSVTIVGCHDADSVVDRIQIKAIPWEEQRLARITRNVWRVYREALRLDADVYHFHDLELIPVGLLLRAAGKQVIYDVHEDVPKDILSKYYLPAWSRGLLSRLVAGVQSTASRRFSAVVAVTPSIASRFRGINRRTVIVRNFPCPEEWFLPQDFGDWESRGESVAYIGGVNAQRGICEMVHAMALLPESLPATLEIAGTELPQHVHPEKLRSHPGWARVRHHGYLKRAELGSLLSHVRAGLVVFHPKPNHWEAMPNKLFEYMGAGLPVIASDFPLWRQIIEGSRCGLLVDPLDPSSIAEAIKEILTHPGAAQEMGRRGREAVQREYNWQSQEPELVNLYWRLMQPQYAA
jgi:glycosyltransferase involved in cell wall biosynthesis